MTATGLATALAPAGAAQEGDVCVPDDPFDVGLVLDRSGSMGGDPIATAREGAIRLVENLTGNDQSGLVSYSSTATLDDPLSSDHASTIDEISQLSAGGSTATGDGIDTSHNDFLDNGRAGVNQTMILLTDGKTNTGPDPVAEADEAKADGIEIFAIGLGTNINEADLKEIASDPVDEHFFNPETTEELLEVFANITGELTSFTPFASEAYAAQATVTTSQSVREVQLHKVAQATTPEGVSKANLAEASIPLGNRTLELGVVNDTAEGASTEANATAEGRARIANTRLVDASGEPIFSAELLTTRASVWSNPSDQAASADGTGLAGLEVMGQTRTASVAPNTVIPLGSQGTLTLNEQITTSSGENVTLRVNLIHLELDDGSRSLDLVVGSAYAAAVCSTTASFEQPVQEDRPISGEAEDDETTHGPVTFNPGGCAENIVGVSVTGCAWGALAVSALGGASSPTGVTVSGTNTSSSTTGLAVSGTGPSDAGTGAAVSGTGPATTGIGAAVSGTGPASTGIGAAVSGTGPASVPIGVAASGTGSATTIIGAAVSGTGSALAPIGVAVSGTGPATTIFGAAVSGTDAATTTDGAAVSGTGPAEVGDEGAAVTGTGTADGPIAAGATGTCNARPCNNVTVTGNATGHNTAISPTGDSDARQGAAASGTQGADVDLGVALSGLGPANADTGAAVSGTDNATATVAVTGTGTAQGDVAAGATGTCNGRPCNNVTAAGNATGHNTAISPTGESDARQGVAVSGTGNATADTGLAVGGCSGATVDAPGVTVHRDSPHPVCT